MTLISLDYMDFLHSKMLAHNSWFFYQLDTKRNRISKRKINNHNH